MRVLRIWCYGSNEKAMAVEVKGLIFYFSYETIIGFNDGERTYISENLWGPTTGKHINLVADDRPRMNRLDFLKALNEALERA